MPTKIGTKENKNYKAIFSSEMIDFMTSKNTLKGFYLGSKILTFEQISSTNEKAHSLALNGLQEGTLIVAKRQTKGRGRRGNSWYSPEGGLYCSTIIRPDIAPKEVWILERLMGIVVYQTVAHLVPKRPRLKPPNDIYVHNKKVAGILIESRGGERKIDYIIIGVGINCSMPYDAFPSYLKDRATTLIKESGNQIQVSDTLDIFLIYLNYWYKIFLSKDIEKICNKWEKLVNEGMSCQICF